MKGDDIIGAVQGVTKKWAKQRKAEERHANAEANRRAVMTSNRYTIKDAAWDVMEDAYLKASGGGTLPAHARQVMYAARPAVQEQTGQTLNDQYFTQTLLPDYIEQNGVDWNVVYDARGHFTEPHTDCTIGLGTIGVRNYLGANHAANLKPTDIARPKVKTHGPDGRFGAVLFIEKEGFMPLFKAVQLAERYDIAIMSTKGMSNTASRELIDVLCGEIPLFVLHDFDKAGFSIVGTLQRNTRRYSFADTPHVIDLGLRLGDIEGLEVESAYDRASEWAIKANLRTNGATDEEINVLLHQRVELNAFTSDKLVEWIETKLKEHGVEKIIPDDDLLEDAWRRGFEHAVLEASIDDLLKEAASQAGEAKAPGSLRDTIVEKLNESPESSWDEIVFGLAQDAYDEEDDGDE